MSSKTNNRTVEVYLSFNGKCEEAVEFYRKAIGAEVEMMLRFKESPEPPPPGMTPPGWENKIMHTSLRVGPTMIMASDGCGPEKTGFAGFSLSLAVNSEADADRYFNALADGGKISMPLGKTFWSPRFGMVEDRFGINWMINMIPADQK
jgi:PhnB protein